MPRVNITKPFSVATPSVDVAYEPQENALIPTAHVEEMKRQKAGVVIGDDNKPQSAPAPEAK